MTIEKLEECFNNAIKINANYIGVKIQMQGFSEPEIIINKRENFKAKLEYYKRAYNKDLTLKAFNGIKIIDFDFGDNFDFLEKLTAQI